MDMVKRKSRPQTSIMMVAKAIVGKENPCVGGSIPPPSTKIILEKKINSGNNK
jgi:hypothetical protein